MPAEVIDDRTAPPAATPADEATVHLGRGPRPVPAEVLAAVADPFPHPGERFKGFDVIAALGRGAMGRVYLVRQPAPAERVVVLKVGPHLSHECQQLARLQHVNVVPVYSFHPGDQLQAVCMPFRGTLTLAHVVARLRSENLMTLDGKSLTTAMSECWQNRRSAVSVPADVPVADPDPGRPARATGPFAALRGLAYVDAMLTIVRQVVEGLRAAHVERIVHSDLKPANVLLGDDGTAQLIDFGIAYDLTGRARGQERLGGTRPYMSPEQLQSITEASLVYDERSDLYAVGVMLYELLTGQLPYDPPHDPAGLERDRELRFTPPVPVRKLNPRVPAGVASIIAKCLAPAAEDRYLSAAQLLEDLNRQIGRRPLKYARNTSRRELAGKFLVRHRVLLTVASIVLCASGIAGAFAMREGARADEVLKLEAFAAGEPFAADLSEAEFYFMIGDREPAYRARAWAAGHRALDRFAAWDRDDWFHRPEYQGLPPDRLASYRTQVAGLLLLMANARGQEAVRAIDPAIRAELFREAGNWNRRAEVVHPGPGGCRAVWAQRGFLTRLGGDPAAAEVLTRKAAALPRTAGDAVLEGRQLLTEGRPQAAAKVLTEARTADPGNLWAAFYGALGHHLLDEFREAVAGYDICLSLRSDFFGAYYNRGMARLRLAKPVEAEADFDRAIEARPDWADAHFHRALARESRRQYQGAMADLNKALDLGYTPTSVHLARSRVHGRLGDKAAAEKDYATALKTVPADERGWMARAHARVQRDPAGALKDFEEALKLDPRLVSALQGKAHLLSKAKETRAAADALTRIIDINPDSPDAWAGRGVLRARTDDRDGALADAKEALKLTRRPATVYQVAGIYATTSKTDPTDRKEAYSLLDTALRAGYGFEHLKTDPELDAVRTDPEFQNVVDRARAYREALRTSD